MKNIPPLALPHFHIMDSKDLDSFLFEFHILCHSYNYIRDAQKLKLFPAALKDLAFRWFMGLGKHTIRSWDDMRIAFLKKYQEYCRTRDSHNNVFRMQQQEDKSLEDYVERFACNLQKNRNELNNATIKTIYFKRHLRRVCRCTKSNGIWGCVPKVIRRYYRAMQEILEEQGKSRKRGKSYQIYRKYN